MIDKWIRYGMTSLPTREFIAKWAVYVKDHDTIYTKTTIAPCYCHMKA